MSNHSNHLVERHCDVAIIGGSAAGLAAAVQLGRQRRSVIVIDAGEPRNGPAAHMHGYLGHDGVSPARFAAHGRDEVRSYGGEVLAGRAVDVRRTDDDRFVVDLVGGHTVIARRVLAATGLVDELPDVDGLAQHWGSDVIHCPFCHGYEVRDRHIVQIVTHPIGLHTAGLFRQLTEHLTIVLHSGVGAEEPELEALRAAGVDVVDGPAARVVADDQGRVAAVEISGGGRIAADAVVVGTRFRIRAEPFTSLDLALIDHPSGLGQVIGTDPSGRTSVPGLYAAGNVTDPGQQVVHAAANGSWVGGMISADLARADIDAADRPSANRADWDRRYGGDQIWSGNPNGSLVTEVGALTPGRALDVGAGEGGDAVWLAEQGWRVDASDISGRALARIRTVASERGLTIECLHADANAARPFPIAAFDLVTAHYASIPRTADGRGVANVVDAVAPGGTLLVVGHDIEPMRTPIDTTIRSRAFDPDAYVRPDDFALLLGDSPHWVVERHETRARPAGAASASHHVDDVVFRARRIN